MITTEYYAPLLLLLIISRGMDFLSTWVGTPNLVLESNPLAKKLGWKWGILSSLAVCSVCAFSLLPAIVISTGSVVVAMRNFQHAWVARSMGERRYLAWYTQRV